MKKLVLKIIGVITVCLVIGAISGAVTADAIPGWYTTLNKPSFNPPNWLFAPVWTTLYVLMGISAGLVWNRGIQNKEIRSALSIFGIHLFFNFLWSMLFFGLKSPVLAMAEIIVLLVSIIWFTVRFYKIRPVYGLLQIPYILWVSFASVLNLSIVLLN